MRKCLKERNITYRESTTPIIPIYTYEGYEGDDVIGTIARQAREKGHKTYILTGEETLLGLTNYADPELVFYVNNVHKNNQNIDFANFRNRIRDGY